MSSPRGAARRFRLLVFDWDGTLMDSTASIGRSCRAGSGIGGHGEASENAVVLYRFADGWRIIEDLPPPPVSARIVIRGRGGVE